MGVELHEPLDWEAQRFVEFTPENAPDTAAALIHLGWDFIPVSLEPNWPALVYDKDVNSWPGVSDEIYTEEEAMSIFKAYFRNPEDKLW